MLKIRFSEQELIDLLYAWAAITFAFAVLLSGKSFSYFSENLIIAGFTVGLAFLVHEISHKVVAQRYNCWAEFRKFDLGLILAVISSFLGFAFVMPGAVLVFGFVSEKEDGKISTSGPLANIILALLFLICYTICRQFLSFPIIVKILANGISINSWLAFFNLLPLPPMDGAKVIRWSPPIWGFLFLISGLMVFLL